MSSQCAAKSSWPELVGVDADVAAATIEKQNPGLHAILVPERSAVIMDFRCDRVWVWVNGKGKVVRVPKIGKSSWPELVGEDGDFAAARIEKQNSNVNAIVLLEGTPVTKDFRCNRVWVWINKNGNGKVVRVPQIG